MALVPVCEHNIDLLAGEVSSKAGEFFPGSVVELQFISFRICADLSFYIPCELILCFRINGE